MSRNIVKYNYVEIHWISLEPLSEIWSQIASYEFHTKLSQKSHTN